MTQIITVHLTAREMQDAHRRGLNRVVQGLLSIATGTSWCVSECGVGLELESPYRSAIVCHEYQQFWREWRQMEATMPYELQLEV